MKEHPEEDAKPDGKTPVYLGFEGISARPTYPLPPIPSVPPSIPAPLLAPRATVDRIFCL
jgi:hypothetical protein